MSRFHILLPGQSTSLQVTSSLFDPGQVRPPAIGGGLSHDRRRALAPSPHVMEHALKSDQVDQLPLTVRVNIKQVITASVMNLHFIETKYRNPFV